MTTNPFETLSVSDEAQQLIEFRFGLEASHRQTLRDANAFWFLPIGTRRDEIYGVRVLPGANVDECPVVRMLDGDAYGQASTVVSRPSSLIPFLAFPGSVVSRNAWDQVAQAPDAVWAELERVHAALGGTDGLRAVREVLASDDFRRACDLSDKGGDIEAVLPTIRKQLDPAPETVRYVDYVRQLLVEQSFVRPPRELGCWGQSAASAAWVAAQDDGGTREEDRYDLALALVSAQAGIDTFQRDFPSYSPSPNGSSEQLFAAAELLTSAAVPDGRADIETLWRPVATALSDERDDYRASRHFELCERFQAEGRRAEAFYAVASAGYWLTQVSPKLYDEVPKLVAFIAENQPWPAVVASLRTFMGQ